MFKLILGALAALVTQAAFSADINPQFLYRLRDVSIGTQTDGQALVWDATIKKWVPGAGGGGGSVTGSGSTGTLALWASSSGLTNANISTVGSNYFVSGSWFVAGEVQTRNLLTITSRITQAGVAELADIGKVKSISYSWPSSQGAAGTVIQNDGNGNLSWASAGSGDVTNTYNTTIVTNSYAIHGHNNTLVVSNSFTILTNGVVTLSNLPAPSVLILNADQAITNATLSGLSLSGSTLSASGGGLDTSVTSLGWSGTNLTGFNCATNGATFKVTLTNNAFLAASTFSNLPDTATMKQWTLMVQQDSTGGWALNATNSVVSEADGVFPKVWTNASAITWYYFHTDLSTNNTIAAIANANVHR